MKQYAEHDKIGICHALRGDDMYIRVFSGGYPYVQGDVLLRSNSSNPVYSYGKNYEKNGHKFALFIWTTEKDMSVIEDRFEEAVNEVTDEQMEQVAGFGSFTYLG